MHVLIFVSPFLCGISHVNNVMIANVLDIAGEMAEDYNESLVCRAQMDSRETTVCL